MKVAGMRYPSRLLLSALAVAGYSSVTCSQTITDPGLYAKGTVSLANDDNIYRVTDDLAQSDTYIQVEPELEAIGAIGKHRFRISYDGNYAKFFDASEADYYDHDLQGRIDFEHNLRFSTRFEAGYKEGHEEPGSINRIQLDIQEYNKYDQNFFLAGFAYGQTSAIGRFVVNYRRTDKNYNNNDLDYLSSDIDQITGRFIYRIAPKTRLYVEGVFSELDYEPSDTFELDNTYNRYRVGLTWDFTNKLTGDINIGYQDRDYDQASLRDIDGLAYKGEVTWSINTYTELAMEAKRESIDSSLEDVGGFLRTTYGISLNHLLTERLRLLADVGYANDELVFTASREDKRYAYQVGLEYELYRHTLLTAGYTFEERNSTDPLADFKANIFKISVTVSLDD